MNQYDPYHRAPTSIQRLHQYIVSPMESKFILAIRKLNGAVHVLKDLKFETEVWVLAGGIFAVSSKYSREKRRSTV
jgi:hypothetical protein